MQPDPISPEEKSQPEPVSAQETSQPEPSSVQEAAEPAPPPAKEQKPSRRNIAAIVLGLFVIILLMVVAGLGYWAFTLNSRLNATNQQLSTLQGEHATLQSDYTDLQAEKEKLTSDLDQTKADLETANGDLAAAQNDLKKLQDQNTRLNDKIDSASKLAEILYISIISEQTSDIFKIDSLVKATNDNQLLAQWNKFVSSPTPESYANILSYLITELRNGLK